MGAYLPCCFVDKKQTSKMFTEKINLFKIFLFFFNKQLDRILMPYQPHSVISGPNQKTKPRNPISQTIHLTQTCTVGIRTSNALSLTPLRTSLACRRGYNYQLRSKGAHSGLATLDASVACPCLPPPSSIDP